MRSLLIVTGLLFLAVPWLRAQDVLETKSGSTYQGKVTSSDGKDVEITTDDGATMKIPFAQLTPESQYRVKLTTTPEDGKAILDLADWCVENKLYKEARAQFRKAMKIAPDMDEEIKTRLAKARTVAANEVLSRAKGLPANQAQEKRYLLSMLVKELPLEDASKEAARLLADETTQRKQDALKPGTAPASSSAPEGGASSAPVRASGEPYSDKTRELFQPVIEDYHEMLDDTQEGLAKGGSEGIDEFEKAIKAGDKLRSSLDKLRSKGANDAEVTEALSLADAKLEEAIVDARINLADVYLLRTADTKAAEVIRVGMSQYPKNAQLRQAMDRVTSAASDGDYGWVVRR